MKDSKGRFVKGHKVLDEWLPKMLEGSKRGNQFSFGNKINQGKNS